MNAPISREIALRIAFAAKLLPDIEPLQILKVLDELVGLPPTLDALSKLTLKQLKVAQAADFSAVDIELLKKSLAYLKGEKEIAGEGEKLELQAYAEGDMPDSLRIACASNKGEQLDGHFGSCSRFLIYQVGVDEIRLIDVRDASGPEARDDKNAYRAGLIEDCQVLFVASIGGPAAAKVVKFGVHPVKHPTGGEARERLVQLQTVIATSPPPWLAKAMGHDEESRVRFERSEAEA